MPVRVYVDWNAQNEDGWVWLHLPLSAKDLESATEQLIEGMPIVLYWDPEDPTFIYEMDGILERHHATGTWMARPNGAVRELPKD